LVSKLVLVTVIVNFTIAVSCLLLAFTITAAAYFINAIALITTALSLGHLGAIVVDQVPLVIAAHCLEVILAYS